jgi:hypothetical protein
VLCVHGYSSIVPIMGGRGAFTAGAGFEGSRCEFSSLSAREIAGKREEGDSRARGSWPLWPSWLGRSGASKSEITGREPVTISAA